MPKTISVALKAAMASPVTTDCTLWQITRTDGTAFYFTDHDQDLVFGGHTYVSAIGFSRSAISSNVDLTVDNVDLQGIFDSASINADDLQSGLWDNAKALISLVNWKDLSQGNTILRGAYLGEVNCSPSGIFTATLTGIAQLLAHSIGELFMPSCRANLGDTRCKIDLVGGGWLKTATVAVVTDTQNFAIAVTEPRAVDGWFVGGVVTWTSGANNGRSMEVKAWTQSGSEVALFLPMPRSVTAGDTLTIYAGCDFTRPTCRDKFANMINFRGEPDVPSTDYLLQTPSSIQ